MRSRSAGGGDRYASPRPPRPPTALTAEPRYRWAGRVGAIALRLGGATWRLEWDIPDSVRAIERGGEHLVYAFWHQHIIPLSYAYRGRGIVVMVSTHGDGEYVTQVIHRLGFGTARGSSTRGGLRAAIAQARYGREGHPLGISPDGPRGPRQQCQPGIVLVAQRAGLPIVPLASGMRRGRRLRSWDRFELPGFATRLLITAGEPISIPGDAPLEQAVAEWRPRVQRALEGVEARAQAWEQRRADWRAVGRGPIGSETSP